MTSISKRKQEFINRTNQQIKVYKLLLDGLLSCEQSIQQFSNKALNVRLITALKQANNIDSLSFSIEQNIVKVSEYQNRTYQSAFSKDTVNYVNNNSVTFNIIIDRDKRIDSTQTVHELNISIEYLKKCISEREKEIADYDDCVEAINKIQSKINALKQNFGCSLRDFIADIQINERLYF